MRRVLFILNALCYSGVERMLACSHPEWGKQGVEPAILSLGEEIGPFAPTLQRAGYPLEHLPFRRNLSFFMALWRLLRRWRGEVIHIHCERAHFWLALTARLAGAGRILRTAHAVYPFVGWLRFKRMAQRWASRGLLGVRWSAASRSVAENEASRFFNPCLLLPNWLDDAHFRPPSADERNQARRELGLKEGDHALLSVGDCSPVKNHRLILEALARLPADHPVVYLHAGSSDGEVQERRQAEALGLREDQVRFLGRVEDVRRLLHGADRFVMPSLREGLGVAALEALACGLPVILTEVAGLREVGEAAGGAARMIPPTVEGLETALREGLAAPQAADGEIRAQAAQRLRAAYGMRDGVARYVACYGGERDA